MARSMSDQPRVMMVVRQFSPWVGGTERQARKLSAMLLRLGTPVQVVTGWWQRGTPQREVIDGLPVFRNYTAWNMGGVRGIRRLAGYLYMLTLFWYLWRQRRCYDLVHVHLLGYAAWPAVLAGRWLGKKTVIKIANSGSYSDLSRMQRNDMLPGQRQMLPVTLRADRLVALNPEIVDELQAAGVPPERIEVIPNGVELDTTVKCDYGVGAELIVTYAGRLHPSKGLGVLLAAFQRARQLRPRWQWRLWLLGDGPLHNELEAQVRQLGLTEAVRFWGQVGEVATYLAQTDMFVLPSLSEGLSNALLEAMAHGLPCVASQIGGNTTLIRHGDTGLLVKPQVAEDLAAAFIRLADDEGLRAQLGRRARQAVQAEFSLEVVARRYQALYTRLCCEGAQHAVVGG
jgi:L-malate glycosyltransferase